MTNKKETTKQGKLKKIVLTVLWVASAVFFATSAVLIFKAYDHYLTTVISLIHLAIAVVIVFINFFKAQK